MSVTFRNRTSGAVIRTATLTRASWYLNELPIGWGGNWILEATVVLTDGRSLSERWYENAYGGTPKCAQTGF